MTKDTLKFLAGLRVPVPCERKIFNTWHCPVCTNRLKPTWWAEGYGIHRYHRCEECDVDYIQPTPITYV